jgi:hypothetical protein
MIFVSYASEDRHQVKEIYDRLRLGGYDPWMDSVDIVGGEDWERSIERSLHNADFFWHACRPIQCRRGAFSKRNFCRP